MAFLAGSIMALAMAPTSWWFVMLACFPLFYITLCGARHGRDAAFMGWCFGFGYFLFGLFWIGNALLVPGNEFIWAWPLAVIGLPIGLALFTALPAWVSWRFSNLKQTTGFLFFCAVLMIAEYLRGHIFTGFPWNLYGYTWVETLPMAQAAALLGPYGLSLLTVFWMCLPGFLLVARTNRVATASLISIAFITGAGLYAWGAMRLHTNPTATADAAPVIRLIQPNIPQEDKWNPEKTGTNLDKLITGISGNAPINDRSIIAVWPETAVTTSLMNYPGVGDAIRESMRAMGKDPLLMTGILIRDGDDTAPRYTNSLITWDNDLHVLSRFDKSHLVPFGEYIPLQSIITPIIPVAPLVQFSGFAPGPGPKTFQVSSPRGAIPPFSPLVCYEIIFPAAVTENSTKSEWIVNVTNDGWYGNSPGPYQHLTSARFRAIEEGIPVVRSTNNGISAVIDPSGRILESIAYDTYGVKDVILPLPHQNRPVYTEFKDLLFIFMAIFMALLPSIKRYL